MATKRWQLKGEKLGELIKDQYVEAIRSAVNQGVTEAVRRTHQDSGNAALHWMVGTTRSRPGARADEGNPIGRGADMRGTEKSPPKHSLVGFRGDGGVARGAIIRYVPGREFEEVIRRRIAGRNPEIDISLFNAWLKEGSSYDINANLQEAGQMGIRRIIEVFKSQTRTRKVRLKV